MKVKVATIATVLGFAASVAYGVPSILKTGPDRNATQLQVQLKKIGCLRPKSVKEVGDSNFTIDGAPVDRDFVDFDKYRDYLEPLGVNKIRILTGWAKSEKVKGKIDVAWIDHIVDWCLAHDINPLLELSYGNPIYPGAGGAGLADGIPNTPEGLKEWDRWVDFLANHFKGRVEEWAMWNEPDLRRGNNSPDAVAAFNIRSAKILKKYMPDCRLHGLSLASASPERLESFIKPMGEDVKLFDTFIYHGYVPNPDISYQTDAARKAVLAKYAPHAKLRQGENGAPSEFLSSFALRYIPWSELSQAKYDLRRALGDLGHDVESGLFCMVDINYAPPTYPVKFCNRKGYLRLNSRNEVIQVKRAYYAIQNMMSVFNSKLTRIPEKKISITDPSIALFEYQTRKGEPLFVFWEKGKMNCTKREGGTRVEYDAVIDTESGRPSDSLTTREVIFEWGGNLLKEPVWVDLITGWVYEIPMENQIKHADGITFVRIPAYDSPCFVTERAALDLLSLAACPGAQGKGILDGNPLRNDHCASECGGLTEDRCWSEPRIIFHGDDKTAYRDPAAVFAGGRCHLFFTLVETEEDQSVHSYVAHSESSDLVAWTKPVKITPRSDRDYSSPGNVVKVGDEWVLCFQSYPRPGNRNDGIVRCANSTARLFTSKSKDMQNWSAPELLKVKGPDVPEEKMNRMIDPYLIQDDKCVWWCFYKERVNSVSGVSMSRSADLRIWEPAGRTNGGENVCVVRDSDGYLMMHSPRYGMKFKRSTDLMKWHDLPNRLTLDGEKRPWSKGRLTAGVLLDGRNVAWCGKWILFFHGSGPKTESEGDFDRNASIAVSMQK